MGGLFINSNIYPINKKRWSPKEGARPLRVRDVAQLMSKKLNSHLKPNVLVCSACGELSLVYEPCLVIILKTGGGYRSKLHQEAQQQLNSADNHMAVMEHML